MQVQNPLQFQVSNSAVVLPVAKMDAIQRAYNIVFYERADQRVKDWTLMTSPKPLAAIIATYLVTIKLILPAYMKNRRPYELRSIIKWYNVVQIVANAFATWGIMTSGWTTTYHFGCMLPDYSMNSEALRMLRFLWWTVILKLLELFETAFFILRKKERQASFLHVYHHVSTLIIIWSALKYVGGGITSFSPMINNSVHVIMYSYYLLSSEGSPKLKATLIKYKKWLTIMQMVSITNPYIYENYILAVIPRFHPRHCGYFP
ncbi:hypothetical protein B5X24_HaOG214928 [Helicoverpa armigera]|nr:hypothetical protein B5X24_HaOG214928 [Helicoverpa armigera]